MRPLPSPLAEASKRDGRGLTVLVIRLGALGDILRTLPAVRLLKRGLPRARMLWVVEEGWAGVLDGHPDLDGLILLPRKRWRALARRPGSWIELLRSIGSFRRAMRTEQADLVVDFHGNLRSGVTGWLSGARVRLGHGGHQQKEGNRWLTTHRCTAGSRRASRIERNLDLVRALGLPDHPLPPAELPLVAAGADDAERLIRELGVGAEGYAILNPGASRAQQYKKPPATLLAAACRRLAEHGILACVVWGPGEERDAAAVIDAAGGTATLAPPTDLATLGALLHRARLFVGGDSGPLHLACASGCPVVALYGPTDPEVNRPWAVPHRALHPPGRIYSGVKRHDRRGGFDDLSSESVETAVEELLARVPHRGSS